MFHRRAYTKMLHQFHILSKTYDRYRIPRPSAPSVDPRDDETFRLLPVVPYKHLPNLPDPDGNLMQRSLPYPTSGLITHPPILPPSISPPPVEPNDDNFIKQLQILQKTFCKMILNVQSQD